jgi:hypothetical protein
VPEVPGPRVDLAQVPVINQFNANDMSLIVVNYMDGTSATVDTSMGVKEAAALLPRLGGIPAALYAAGDEEPITSWPAAGTALFVLPDKHLQALAQHVLDFVRDWASDHEIGQTVEDHIETCLCWFRGDEQHNVRINGEPLIDGDWLFIEQFLRANFTAFPPCYGDDCSSDEDLFQ